MPSTTPCTPGANDVAIAASTASPPVDEHLRAHLGGTTMLCGDHTLLGADGGLRDAQRRAEVVHGEDHPRTVVMTPDRTSGHVG
jgi:hypothetical protein